MRIPRLPGFTAVLLAGIFAVPAARAEKFTLAIMPDVQREAYGDTRFRNRLQWLVNNRSALNLKLVLQVGDMMDFNLESQYAFMSEGMKILDRAGMPYVTCIGNHDSAAVRADSGSAAPGNVNANLRNTARYNAYFPTTRFRDLAGVYEAGKIDNAFHTFTAGGLQWMVINLELWARTGAVEWARSVVASHPNHNIIFLTHMHLNSDSTIGQTNGGYGNNSPQFVFERAMKPYANVRLVFSGHVGIHGYRTDPGAGGSTIYQFLQCYHDNYTNPVRLLTIDTSAGTMTTRVYCPSINQDKNDGSARTVTGVKWVQPPVGARPAAPTGLNAATVSSSQITLTWTDASNNETGFKVEGKTGAAGTWMQIGLLPAGSTKFNSGYLKPSTTYFYRVRATNAAGDSAWSNEASATTRNALYPAQAIRVTTSTLNVRNGPSTADSILGATSSGQVWISSGRLATGWYGISYQGKSAYVYGGYVTSVTGVQGARINTALLNVRSGPGTDQAKIGECISGQRYSTDATSGTWLRIRWTGTATAWIHGGYAVRESF